MRAAEYDGWKIFNLDECIQIADGSEDAFSQVNWSIRLDISIFLS